jgi:hypothetical protein
MTTCPRCPHPWTDHHHRPGGAHRCRVDGCPCLLLPGLDIPAKPQRPTVPVLSPAEAREAWIKGQEARVRLLAPHFAVEVQDLLRAAFDTGHTLSMRR